MPDTKPAFLAPAVGSPLLRMQCSFFLLNVGLRCSHLAIAWWTLEQTGSMQRFAWMMASATAAEALSKPLLGWMGDVYPKTRIVQYCNVIGVAAAVCTLWLSTLANFHCLPLTFLMMLSAALVGLRDPIQASLIPEFVPPVRVMKAVRMKAVLWSIALVLGPAIAGILLSSAGVRAALLADVILLLGAALLALSVRPVRVSHQARPVSGAGARRRPLIRGTHADFRTVYRIQMERYLALMAALFNFAFVPFFGVMVPFYVKDVMHFPAWYAGLVDACFGVGVLLGSRVAPSPKSTRLPRDRVVMLGFMMVGVNIIALGLKLPAAALPAFFLFGGAGLVWVRMNTGIVRTLATPAHFRNRMMATVYFVAECGGAAGNACIGPAIALLGVFPTAIVAGTYVVLLACLLRRVPNIRLFMRMPDDALEGTYAKIYPRAFESAEPPGRGG